LKLCLLFIISVQNIIFSEFFFWPYLEVLLCINIFFQFFQLISFHLILVFHKSLKFGVFSSYPETNRLGSHFRMIASILSFQTCIPILGHLHFCHFSLTDRVFFFFFELQIKLFKTSVTQFPSFQF
jgi:hypothetical protein